VNDVESKSSYRSSMFVISVALASYVFQVAGPRGVHYLEALGAWRGFRPIAEERASATAWGARIANEEAR
jgi:hypothetical protein